MTLQVSRRSHTELSRSVPQPCLLPPVSLRRCFAHVEPFVVLYDTTPDYHRLQFTSSSLYPVGYFINPAEPERLHTNSPATHAQSILDALLGVSAHTYTPVMAARPQQGGRPGGARFAQFKLVLLGEGAIALSKTHQY